MRRLVVAGLVLALHLAASAQAPLVTGPMQADAIVRLLADLEAALAAGRESDLVTLAAPDMPDVPRRIAEATTETTAATMVSVRERARRPTENGVEVLAEVFVARGRRGRVATWQLGARTRRDRPDRAELTAFTELGSVDSLLKLSLDTARQFSVHDLTLRGPDMTLRMPSGTAFIAESDNGTTALVLKGSGDVRFAPPVATEQAQLRQFAGKPDLATPIETAFVRINPAAFDLQVTQRTLQPMKLSAGDVENAREVFDQLAGRSYALDLRDLSRDRWSLEPGFNSLVVEFQSKKFGWLTYARSPSESEDVSLFQRDRRRNIAVYASEEKLADRGEFYSDNDRDVYRVEHYALDLRFDPSRSWIAGRATLRVKMLQPAGTLTLKLAEPFAVASVSSSTFGRLLALRVVGQNSLIVSLPRIALPDRALTLEVEYSGRLDPQSASRETLAVTPRQSGQAQPELPTVALQPEPRYVYSNSLAWYPQAPAPDYATATMRLTVPSEYQLVASGGLLRASLAPQSGPEATTGRDGPVYVRTSEYQTDRPVRYLACVISRFVPVGQLRTAVPALAPAAPGPGPRSELRPLLVDEAPAVNIEVVATPRQSGRNRGMPAKIADVLQFYARTLGEAPYPDFTLAGIDDNLPGGHSPAYFALLQQPLPTSPYSWGSDPVAFDNFSSFFLAHEIAHQWWGQAIGWKNYHDQWLSEGLAQYFAVLYLEHERGPAAARNVLGQMRASAMASAGRGPIYLGQRLGQVADDPRLFRAIAYNKSAVVVHMLRRLMGDEAFMRGLKRFYATWRFRKAGTDDFRVAFEAEAGMPLDRFIRGWVMEASLPVIRVTTRTEDGGAAAVVRIEQSGPVFVFPYTVTLQYQDGSTEAVTIPVSTAVAERRVPLAGALRRIETRDDLTLAVVAR